GAGTAGTEVAGAAAVGTAAAERAADEAAAVGSEAGRGAGTVARAPLRWAGTASPGPRTPRANSAAMLGPGGSAGSTCSAGSSEGGRDGRGARGDGPVEHPALGGGAIGQDDQRRGGEELVELGVGDGAREGDGGTDAGRAATERGRVAVVAAAEGAEESAAGS